MYKLLKESVHDKSPGNLFILKVLILNGSSDFR